MTKMSPSIFMILTNFMLDLDTWTPWDAVQTTPGMSIGPPFITGKKISSGIFRFWQPWLVTWKLFAFPRVVVSATKKQNRRKCQRPKMRSKSQCYTKLVVVIGVYHLIGGVPRILKHFSDPKSVKIWWYNDGAKVKKEKKPTWGRISHYICSDIRAHWSISWHLWHSKNSRTLFGSKIR